MMKIREASVVTRYVKWPEKLYLALWFDGFTAYGGASVDNTDEAKAELDVTIEAYSESAGEGQFRYFEIEL